MTWIQDDCSPVLYNCIAVGFRDICLDRERTSVPLTGALTINLPDGTSFLDSECTFFVGCPKIQSYTSNSLVPCVTENGCEVFLLKTCQIPANIDSDYDPDDDTSVNRALETAGTYYTLTFKVGTKKAESFDFVLDAAAVYSDLCGCVPLKEVTIDGSFPPGEVNAGDPFANAVCEALHTYEDGGDLPCDGSIKIIGLSDDGTCKSYRLPECCTDEDKLNIVEILTEAQN